MDIFRLVMLIIILTFLGVLGVAGLVLITLCCIRDICEVKAMYRKKYNDEMARIAAEYADEERENHEH